MNIPRILLTASLSLAAVTLPAQTCTTQSQMQPAGRDALAAASLQLALAFQSQNQAAVKADTDSDLAANFSAVADVIRSTAPRLQGATPQVEQLYILDASTQKAATDTQFFCTLNKSAAEADFSIPQLPPAKYAFAMVRFDGPTPTRLSFLLKQSGTSWQLAGIYPKPLEAAGHDGLWYWKQARQLATAKDPWSAWLYLQQAQILLQPADFVSSSHLEKLATEIANATPPSAKALSSQSPLVLKAADGQEFRFTQLTVDDTFATGKVDKPDIAAHLKVDALGDAATARQRNLAAAAALLAAHPELRASFHGVLLFADTAAQGSYTTEFAMPEIK